MSGPHVNRAPLEDIYARTLDDWEHRLFGTRSHVAALEYRRSRVRFMVQQSYVFGLGVIYEKSPLIITSVA